MMQSKNIPAWQISIIIIAVLIVLAHIIVSGLHGIAHTQNEVRLSDLQYVYVFFGNPCYASRSSLNAIFQ
jgi:hypothetical protein